MKLRSRPDATAPAAQSKQEAGKFEGFRPIAHDEDADRPSREDLGRGRSPFRIPVPLPRFFFPKSKRRPHD